MKIKKVCLVSCDDLKSLANTLDKNLNLIELGRIDIVKQSLLQLKENIENNLLEDKLNE